MWTIAVIFFFFFLPFQSQTTNQRVSFVWICLWRDPSIRVSFSITKPCAPMLYGSGNLAYEEGDDGGYDIFSLDSWQISFYMHVIHPWTKWSLDISDLCYL